MNLAMDLAALCDKWSTNGCQLAIYSEDVAFVHHFVVTHPPPPLHPIRVLVVLAAPVKTLKQSTIQLAIQSIVGE